MVAEIHRLGALQVRVPGHRPFRVLLGARQQRCHELGQPGLHVHVDVFHRGIQLPFAAFELAGDGFQTVNDRVGVGRCDESHRRQHPRMCLASAHVIAQQPTIEVDGRVERCRRRVHRCLEAGATSAALRSCHRGGP